LVGSSEGTLKNKTTRSGNFNKCTKLISGSTKSSIKQPKKILTGRSLYGLFNNTVSSSDYITSNGWTIIEEHFEKMWK
jgi:hypothetical protein